MKGKGGEGRGTVVYMGKVRIGTVVGACGYLL